MVLNVYKNLHQLIIKQLPVGCWPVAQNALATSGVQDIRETAARWTYAELTEKWWFPLLQHKGLSCWTNQKSNVKVIMIYLKTIGVHLTTVLHTVSTGFARFFCNVSCGCPPLLPEYASDIRVRYVCSNYFIVYLCLLCLLDSFVTMLNYFRFFNSGENVNWEGVELAEYHEFCRNNKANKGDVWTLSPRKWLTIGYRPPQY